MDLSSAQIAIIGLDYVGLPLVAEFGKKRPVLGFDFNIARVSALQSDRDSTLEVEPQDRSSVGHLQFNCNAEPPEGLRQPALPGCWVHAVL